MTVQCVGVQLYKKQYRSEPRKRYKEEKMRKNQKRKNKFSNAQGGQRRLRKITSKLKKGGES